MGFIFNGQSSDDLNICIKTLSIPIIPPRRQHTISVPGMDGEYVFEDGYNNIKIELECTLVGDPIYNRRKQARIIALWLAKTGRLSMSYESDIEYIVVKTMSTIDAVMNRETSTDVFKIVFECLPYVEQSFYTDKIKWGEAHIPWGEAHIPWGGYPRKFNLTAEQTIKITNNGTFVNKPIIILTGVSTSVTIGECTINNLNGTVYIDCKNGIVYSLDGETKINKMMDYTSTLPEKFIRLYPGDNYFDVTGPFANIDLEFDYRNTFL